MTGLNDLIYTNHSQTARACRVAVRVLSPHLHTRLATCSPATAAWKWTGTAEKQRCFTSTTDCTVRNGEEGGSGEISTSWDPPLLFSIFICH